MKALDLIAPVLQAVTLQELAEAAGLSRQSLKQYRQPDGQAGHRKPSPEAQAALLKAIAKLAKGQAAYFTKLAQQASKGLERHTTD